MQSARTEEAATNETARGKATLTQVVFEREGAAVRWQPDGTPLALDQGKRYIFGRNTPQIGGPENVCRAITDNPMVARAHCVVEFDEGAGGWVVADCSFNGTTVFCSDMAACELLRRNERALRDGDVIMLHEGAPGLLFSQSTP